MSILDEKSVLNFYLKEIDKDEVNFLINEDEYKEIIKTNIIGLRDAKNMNDKIDYAKKLWKSLFESAMSFIDPNKAGYDDLFAYFDDFVSFEELIFASDSFYRDHTLHCLWVYFLGEYISKNDSFKELPLRKSILLEISSTWTKAIEEAGLEEEFGDLYKINKSIDNSTKTYKDSIYCVSSLTHDLGYPLKKIEKINKSIKKILPRFSISDYNEFNFEYSSVKNNFVQSFIKYLSMNFDYVYNDEKLPEFLKNIFVADKNTGFKYLDVKEMKKFTNEQKKEIKGYLDISLKVINSVNKEWAYNKDFEEYKHGIMSAFLLVKNVAAFNNIQYVSSNIVEIYDLNTADVYVKQGILRAIADHTNKGFRIKRLGGYSEYLTFIDELEEFSRLSRANQNREYISEFCQSDISINECWFNIDFIFSNKSVDTINPEKAFKGRCERFLSLFDITRLDSDLKIRLRCIDKLSDKEKIYSLEIARGYAKVEIDGEEKDIPSYLKSNEFYSRAGYARRAN